MSRANIMTSNSHNKSLGLALFKKLFCGLISERLTFGSRGLLLDGLGMTAVFTVKTLREKPKTAYNS